MSGALTTHLRRMWRAALTTESLLSEDEAVEALPGRPEATRPWLRDQVAPAGAIGSDPVFRWGDVLATLAGKRGTGASTEVTGVGFPVSRAISEDPRILECEAAPLTSWREVARACGVSEDTLARRRREYDPNAKALFATRDEAWAWFTSLGRAPARARSMRSTTVPGPTLASRSKR